METVLEPDKNSNFPPASCNSTVWPVLTFAKADVFSTEDTNRGLEENRTEGKPPLMR